MYINRCICKCIRVCSFKAKIVSSRLHESVNTQLNFDHPKGPGILEAGEACTGNTEEGFMENLGPELRMEGEEPAQNKS